MSFLEHLDEFRRQTCKFSNSCSYRVFDLFLLSPDKIFNFLSVPIRQALSEANRREVPVEGITGNEKVLSLNTLNGRQYRTVCFRQIYDIRNQRSFIRNIRSAKVEKDATGKIGLFTDEPIFTSNAIIPRGIRLPVDFEGKNYRRSERGRAIDCNDGDRAVYALRYGFALRGDCAFHSVSCCCKFGGLSRPRSTNTNAHTSRRLFVLSTDFLCHRRGVRLLHFVSARR